MREAADPKRNSIQGEQMLRQELAKQCPSRERVAELAEVCVAEWNVIHNRIGSYADAHSTL